MQAPARQVRGLQDIRGLEYSANLVFARETWTAGIK
jgi:hypothetical protein